MKLLILGFASLGLFSTGVEQAVASTILYNNISAANTAFVGVGPDYGAVAASFSTGSAALSLSDVQLLLEAYSPPAPTGILTVNLLGDNSTSPGAFIATIGTLSAASLSSSLAVFDFPTAPISLSANTRYWVQLTDTTDAFWGLSSHTSGTGVAGEYLATQSGVTSNVGGEGAGGLQMEVTATAAVAAVAEPATLTMLGIGIAGMAGYGWRQRKPAAA